MLNSLISTPGWMTQFKGLPASAHGPSLESAIGGGIADANRVRSKTSTPKPNKVASVLDALNSVLGGTQDAPMMGFAQGLLAASAPHLLTPIPMSEALGMGLHGSQEYQHSALANAMQRAVLPMKRAETRTILQALQGHGSEGALPSQALVMNLLGGSGAARQLVGMNPALVAGATQAKEANTPFNQGPNTATINALAAARGGLPLARATLPQGAVQIPGTGAMGLAPGAQPSIAQSAFANAGGAGAARLPMTIAAEQARPHALMPGANLVNPSGAGGGVPPAVAALLRQKQMEHITGEMLGANNAANAAHMQGPMPEQPPGAPQGHPLQGPPPGAPQAPPAQPPQPNPQQALAAAQAHAQAVAGTGAGNVMAQGEPLAMAGAQKALGSLTGRDVEDANEESSAARQQVAVYNQMGQALSQIGPTGAWRDLTTPLAHIANYLGLKPLNITSIAEFDKYRTQMVGAATKAVSPRASTQEMNFLSKSVPDVNMPGKAASVLVSELRGLSQYQVIKANGLTWYMQHVAPTLKGPYGGTSMAFEKWWTNNGPSPSAIVLTSVMTNLSASERVAYRKALLNNPTGKHMWRQAMKARAFEQAAPDVFQGL